MFKVTVSSKYRATLAAKMKNLVDDKFARDVQQQVVDGEIKKLIASGTSPVESPEGRRFAGYKDTDKYPGDKKSKRPVNLNLTGAMLNFYRAIKTSGTTLTIGIATNAPQDIKVRAEANNIGTTSSNGESAIRARRFIPLKGETYRVSVMRKIKDLYARRIAALLSYK